MMIFKKVIKFLLLFFILNLKFNNYLLKTENELLVT